MCKKAADDLVELFPPPSLRGLIFKLGYFQHMTFSSYQFAGGGGREVKHTVKHRLKNS